MAVRTSTKITTPSNVKDDGVSPAHTSSSQLRTVSAATPILNPPEAHTFRTISVPQTQSHNLSTQRTLSSSPAFTVPRTPSNLSVPRSQSQSSQSSRTKSEGVAFRPGEDELLAPGTFVSEVQNKTDEIKQGFWTKRRVKIAATIGVVLLVSLVAAGLFFIPGGPLIAVGAALTGAVGSGGSALVSIGSIAGLSGAAGMLAHWLLPTITTEIDKEIIPELYNFTNEDEAIEILYNDTQRDFNLTINGKKLPKKPSPPELKNAFHEAFPDLTKRLAAIKLAAQRSSQAVIDQWKMIADREDQYVAASFGNESNVTITSDADGNPIIKGEIDACLYDLQRSDNSKTDRHIIKRQTLKYEINWGTETLIIK